MRGQKFLYYHNGMLWAEVHYDCGGATAAKRDLETGRWHSHRSLAADDGIYSRTPLAEIEKQWHEYQQMAAAEEAAYQCSSGRVYRVWKHVEGTVEGRSRQGMLWAQQNQSDPIDVITCGGDVAAFVCVGRTGITVLVRPGFEALTPLSLWNDEMLSPPGQGVEAMGTQETPMRDGITLASELLLPARRGPKDTFPAIVVRTPYGRLSNSYALCHFVDRGYGLIIQDTRGRHDSQGEFEPNVFETADGEDTLQWTASQAWCSGKIGMIGSSYGGFVQWAAAASGSPYLHAIVSRVTAGTPFYDIPIRGGALLSGMLAWAFMVSERISDSAKAARDDWEDVLRIRPLKDIPRRALGYDIPFWNRWLAHPSLDAYWEQADWTRKSENIDVPALMVSGWYDDDGIGTSQAWQMMKENGRRHQQLVLGPWQHKFNTAREIHNIQFGSDAVRYDLEPLYLRWFDRFLKDIGNGVEQRPAVEYYRVGDNRWETASTWPPPEASLTPLYLHGGDGGALRWMKPQSGQQSSHFVFNPEHPAPHLIDVSENELHVPEDYQEMETRPDVLVYTSEPLADDMILAGDIEAVLYSASDCPDTDWVVRLTDVHPDGRSIRLTEGLIRARFRRSFTSPALLEPGSIEQYGIPMNKIAVTIQKGHRIRVQVTSGAHHLIFPNPNTGEDPAQSTGTNMASQTVCHSAEHPSCVLLPVVQRR